MEPPKFSFANRKIQDGVHGQMEFAEVLMKFIDTPEFQRLRNIRQLGGAYYVYPAATHTRFEHSLGTCWIAGKLAKLVQQKVAFLSEQLSVHSCTSIDKPESVTDKDVLCVQIAALCHDLGHASLSHLFDGLFMPLVKPELEWKHERASIEMFDHLLMMNPDIKLELCQTMDFDDQDFIFIKELIYGPLEKMSHDVTDPNHWPYKGRSVRKCFLYEIVANKLTGIDVDKFEYIQRDAVQVGVPCAFDFERYLAVVQVLYCKEDCRFHLGLPKKAAFDVYELFATRATLHRKVYQHKTVRSYELMLADAMMFADKHVTYSGVGREQFSMSECYRDMHAYSRLDDGVLRDIDRAAEKNPDNADLQKCAEIRRRIDRRVHYDYFGETNSPVPPGTQSAYRCGLNTEVAKEILEYVKDDFEEISADSFYVYVSQIDMGMLSKNPLLSVYFQCEDAPYFAERLRSVQEVSHTIPEIVCEQLIRLYSREALRDSTMEHVVLEAFKKWCDAKGLPPPRRSSPTKRNSQRSGATTPTLPLGVRVPFSFSLVRSAFMHVFSLVL